MRQTRTSDLITDRHLDVTTDESVAVNFLKDQVQVTLADGRILSTPLARHPWLVAATPEQRNHYELGYLSVWWPDLDEGLDIEWMLRELDNPQSSAVRLVPQTTVKSPRSQ
ncbi:MAG: DUF2442 domain-containing protein [Anaerolineae bacterium]|nr:DUF2442 domain-containing protein [Anaerolineae bacterium]